MNELQAIVKAYKEACAQEQRAALATVVNVNGSAYRRPGARMLITESGHCVGSISGGCLERDVVERATEVMSSGAARIIEYDTRGSEDIIWGLGLGCNGVVQVLLESLEEGSCGARALQFIKDCLHANKSGVLATVIRASKTANHKKGEGRAVEVGERLFLNQELNLCNRPFTNSELVALIHEDAQNALAGKGAKICSYEISAGCQTAIFFDVIAPPLSLVVFGAERDAEPVVQMARTLGWHTTVVDTRARVATLERFREADAVVLCRAEEIAARVPLMPGMAAVVMTHNYLDDVDLLRTLLSSEISYLGILGPKQRTAKLFTDLRAEGVELFESDLARLHSPIGIDIGAETPEEIALAIISEIKAVTALRRGGFLRDRDAPLHDDYAGNLTAIEVTVEPHTNMREIAPVMVCQSS